MQLDHEAVLADIEGDELVVVPLQNPASWPNWQPRTIHRVEGLDRFEHAGPGMFVLHRTDGAPPQLVHIACTKSIDE
jgi:hypothetical protein